MTRLWRGRTSTSFSASTRWRNRQRATAKRFTIARETLEGAESPPLLPPFRTFRGQIRPALARRSHHPAHSRINAANASAIHGKSAPPVVGSLAGLEGGAALGGALSGALTSMRTIW